MTLLVVRVEVEKAQRQLRQMNKEIAPRRILKTVGQRLIREIDRGFIQEKQPGGARWLPLAESTIRRRRNKSTKILQDTGRLRQSYKIGQPIRLTSRLVEIGTNVFYADIHQRGKDQVPARPMLPTQEHADKVVGQEVEAIVNKAAKRASG